MDDAIAWVNANQTTAAAIAGGAVLLILILFAVSRGGKKKKQAPKAEPAARAPEPAPERAPAPTPAAAPEPAPAAAPRPAPAPAAGATPGDMILAAAEARGLRVSHDAVNAAIQAAHGERKVLWVDDQPDTVANEIGALRGLGATVDHVTTNADAAEAIKSGGYAIVVTDIDRQKSEGGKAGLYLPRVLREQANAEPPVIFYVGVVSKKMIEGRYPCTSSPVELLDLIARGSA